MSQDSVLEETYDEVSVLEEKHAEVSLNWKIKNFFPLRKEMDYYIDSPSFSLSDAKWYLSIYPNGYTEDGTHGWVSLYLSRECFSSREQSVTFTIDIRRSDESIYKTGSSENLYTSDVGYGALELLKTSELLESKATLSSDDSLTVFCTARITTSRVVDATTAETASQTSSLESVYTLERNFKDLLLNGTHGDTTIKVKDREFQVHRCILAVRSSVFRSMFEHDMLENTNGVINIEEFEPEDFQDFLIFVYTGKMDHVTPTNAPGLYKISHKYDLKELKEECVKCMGDGLSVDSFCEVALLASVYDESELLHTATDFFIKNMKAVVRNLKWPSFLAENSSLANEFLIKLADTI